MPSLIEKQITKRFVQAAFTIVGPSKDLKSKKDLADALHLFPQAVTKLQAGTMCVQLDTIRLLMKLMPINLNWLFTGVGEMITV